MFSYYGCFSKLGPPLGVLYWHESFCMSSKRVRLYGAGHAGGGILRDYNSLLNPTCGASESTFLILPQECYVAHEGGDTSAYLMHSSFDVRVQSSVEAWLSPRGSILVTTCISGSASFRHSINLQRCKYRLGCEGAVLDLGYLLSIIQSISQSIKQSSKHKLSINQPSKHWINKSTNHSMFQWIHQFSTSSTNQWPQPINESINQPTSQSVNQTIKEWSSQTVIQSINQTIKPSSHSFNHSLTHKLTHSRTHSLTNLLTYSVAHSSKQAINLSVYIHAYIHTYW